MSITDYRGYVRGGLCRVTYQRKDCNEEPLPPRHDLKNHSPDGFVWGYNGSEPAQLALALLAFEMGDQFALDHYQDFKATFVARWPQDGEWRITSDHIEGFARNRRTVRV